MEEIGAESPDARSSVLRERYELGRVLGHGTFAKVYHAREVATGRHVAMKVVGKERVVRAGMMEQVKREIAAMKRAAHPHVVELHEVMATRTKIFLAMELVRGGELFSLVSRSGRLPEPAARKYFRQLLSAVDFCHSRGVFHRDLKPENLLLDDHGDLKVADFGLSAFSTDNLHDDLLRTACGTPAYVAPEVIARKGYHGAKADLWSCGVILFVLLAGFLPFHDENIVNMYRKIHRSEFHCPPWVSSDARRLITRLLDPNPNNRYTVAKVLDSSWFRKPSPPSSSPPLPLSPPPEKKDPLEDPPETMNAFHLISMSQGVDLSPLFRERNHEGMRFATREPAAGIISRLEGAAAKAGGRMKVTKSSAAGVRLEGEECGRRGRLSVAADIFTVAPSVIMVEVKQAGGDALEYRSFCCNQLRPALQDIVWAAAASPDGEPTAAA